MNFPFMQEQTEREIPRPPSGADRLLELESRLTHYQRLYWSTALLFLLALGLLWKISPRAPLVVGLAQSGQMTALAPLSREDEQSRFRLILSAFVHDFLRNFTEYDSFQEPYRLSRAFRMMTPDLRNHLRTALSDNQFVSKITASRIRSRLEIKESQIHEISTGIYSIVVVSVRHVHSYDDPSRKRDDILKSRLVVREGEATDSNPYGLWVSSYAEHLIDRTAIGGKSR
ncbi:MAG: hypothetical protein ACYC9S_05625 [Leptospirales bacterium]